MAAIKTGSAFSSLSRRGCSERGVPTGGASLPPAAEAALPAPTAELSVSQAAPSAPALAGAPLEYTVTVTNHGPDTAHGVRLLDALPAGLESPEYSTNGGAAWSPWHGTLLLGTLAPGAVQALLLRGTVAPSASGPIVNRAHVLSATADPNLHNNTALATVAIQPSADLSVVLTSAPRPAVAGSPLVFTATVFNAGPSDADGLTLTAALPAGLDSPEYSTDGGVAWRPWPGFAALGILMCGKALRVLLRGTVAPDATGPLVSAASVASLTHDPDPSDNSCTDSIPVEPLPTAPPSEVAAPAAVSLTMTASAFAVPGNYLDYLLILRNTGPSEARDVLLADALPSALSGPEYSVDGGTVWLPWHSPYSVGTLAPGAVQSLLLRGTVRPSVTGLIANSASVTSSAPGSNAITGLAEVKTPVAASASLFIAKAASPESALPGQTLLYTLVAANAGPACAEVVTLRDALPPALSGAEYSADGGAVWQPWSGSLALGALEPGDSRTILLRATLNATVTGTLTSTATVSSPTPEPDPDDNSVTLVTAVAPSADLSVTKTAEPDPATAGRWIVYTLTAANAGPDAAEAVVLHDTLPAALGPAYCSLDLGAHWQPWSGSLSLGALAAGSAVTVLITGSIARCSVTGLENTAQVLSATYDPNPANNSVTTLTRVYPPAPLRCGGFEPFSYSPTARDVLSTAAAPGACPAWPPRRGTRGNTVADSSAVRSSTTENARRGTRGNTVADSSAVRSSTTEIARRGRCRGRRG